MLPRPAPLTAGVGVLAPRPCALGDALAVGLGGLGWLVSRPPEAPRPPARTLFVLEDDAGVSHPPAASSPLPRGSVCVGSSRSLAGLVTLVDRGGVALSQDAPFTQLLRAVHEHLAATAAAASQQGHRQRATLRRQVGDLAALARLTPAELAVLGQLIRGLSATQIAARSRRSLHTVRSQIKAVLAKLGVDSQLGAVALGQRVAPAAWLERELRVTTFGDDP